MSNHIYNIRCLTNLHVGSGETGGIVDNSIQRDSISRHPVIHGPSLKGALREYCKHQGASFLYKVFGSVAATGPGTIQGSFRFFSAHLISIPMRSNKLPYFNVTCREAVKEYLSLSDYLGITITQRSAFDGIMELKPDNGALTFNPASAEGKIEDFPIKVINDIDIKELIPIIGEHPAVIDDMRFSDYCENELPVIARNHLNNGKSTNLWYEEIVPREGRFVFGLIGDDSSEAEFENTVKKATVQIGGNATVGYGFTEIRKLF
jgi:CRISPR-associated protein Cmr4